MNVAIIGGGMMGLSLAHRLSKDGYFVTVYERDKQLGGLATYHDYGGFIWDRFYHVVLPTDLPLISFFKEIGLYGKLHWHTTQTGFYVDKQFYSLNSNIDFLRFPPLTLWNKFRLAINIIYASRINDWKTLERIPVEDWLIKYSGKQTYEKIWKPLLLAKLGENYKRVSAVFIWSYIKRLYSARDSSAQKEQMGYVEGGYKTIIERLSTNIIANGGRIIENIEIKNITKKNNNIMVSFGDACEDYEKVVFTAPVNVLQNTVSEELVKVEHAGDKIEYSGVVCMVLVTRKEITPYYTLNITDNEIPFTGVIGMSSIVPISETGNHYLTYFPKYVHSNDSLLRKTDQEIKELFFSGVRKMFAGLREEDIVSVHINRASRVQPLQVLNYSKLVPTITTKHPDFYVLNTAQFVNNTLNNNAVISSVNHFLDEYWEKQ